MTGEFKNALNTKELLEIMDYEEGLIKICFEDFLAHSLIMLDDIKRSIDVENPSMLNQTAHKFKGSLKYLAAYPAAKVAYQLEIIGTVPWMVARPYSALYWRR